MTASEKLQRALTGAVAGCAMWMLVVGLGVPHIFGLGDDAGLIPAVILCALISLNRLHRLPVYATIVLLVVTLLVAYTPIVVAPSRALIRSDPLPKSADAVIALSAGINADGYLSWQGMDRTLSAMKLVKSGVAPRLIVTRERRRLGDRIFASSGDQAALAQLAGLNEVITTGGVKNTRAEAVEVARIARVRGWHRVIVVTSPMHTKRACATFEKTGLSVTCVASDSRDIAVNDMSLPHDRLRAFAMLIYEAAGTVQYRQKGWI